MATRNITACVRRLAIARNDVLAIDANVGLNPGMRSLKALYDKGSVAIVQGVGYPNPDHSHFRSTEIWQTAAPDRYEHTGWLGRYFDEAALSARESVQAAWPFRRCCRKRSSPIAPIFRRYPRLSNMRWSPIATPSRETAFWTEARDRRVPFESPYLAHVMEIEGNAQRSSEELPRLVAGYTTKAARIRPPRSGRSLALAAQIVGSNLGTKAIYVEHGSFDTHVNQVATQNRLLVQFSNAIGAFYEDLAAHGNDRRVLTLTFSEFGRRIEENGSRGTDHGEASPLFLIGGGVKGGLYGALPDLGYTNMGNLRYTVDFRSVYATVLERWLGRPSRPCSTAHSKSFP